MTEYFLMLNDGFWPSVARRCRRIRSLSRAGTSALLLRLSWLQWGYTERAIEAGESHDKLWPYKHLPRAPLTAEQDAEVRHYIKVRTQRGLPWDTSELNAMLKDMLQPPGDGNDEFDAPADETKAAAERAMASVDEAMEPIEASEERTAAMESESMKGPKR